MSDPGSHRSADPDEEGSGPLQLIAAILLGLAATLTAISAYQAALSDGDALKGYTESNAAVSEANALRSQADQIFTADQALYLDYAVASYSDQTDIAEYLLTEIMRPELRDTIFWFADAPDDVQTPFDKAEGNPYVIAEEAQAAERQKAADAAFEEGAQQDDRGDEFELATVLLALTLFFGGIATLFRRHSVSVALLGMSGIALIAGGVQFLMALGA